MLGEPRLQTVAVEGVGVEPVDGGEMAAVGQRGIQTPEDLDDTQGSLGHRLGDITALGGHGADGGQSAHTAVLAQADHLACALVELSQTGGEVCGVALLTGHLLQTTRHLAESLGPTGGGVGDDGHGIAHVAVVLGDGNTRIDRSLTGGHGHIRGVGDQHGALHEGLARAGVGQLGELTENIGHLVAALAAADVDHQIHVAPLGQLVLYHGLTRAEGAGNAGGTALGDGEQSVDGTLTRDHRLGGGELLLVGAGHTDGPLLGEHDVLDSAVLQLELTDTVGNAEITGIQLHDGALLTGRAHDLVGDDLGLLHRAVDVARGNGVAVAEGGLEVPELIPIQSGLVNTLDDVGAILLPHGLQGALDTVVNGGDEAGAQLHRQRRARRHHLVAAAQSRGLLVDLDGGAVAVHLDDLTDQTSLTDTHHVEHIGIPHPLGDDQRTGYLQNFSFYHVYLLLKQYIRANGSFHGGLDGGHARAVGALPSGDGDDGGEGGILVAGNVLGDSLGVVLHDEDDGVGLVLGQRVEDLRGGLGVGGLVDGKADGHKAHNAVPLADDTDLIHNLPVPFPAGRCCPVPRPWRPE